MPGPLRGRSIQDPNLDPRTGFLGQLFRAPLNSTDSMPIQVIPPRFQRMERRKPQMSKITKMHAPFSLLLHSV